MSYISDLFLFGVLLLLFSCDKEDASQLNGKNYLIFGHFYGFCMGESCIEIFKVNDEELWEDINDAYPRQDEFYQSEFIKLDQKIHEKIEDLPAYFPDSLWLETEKVFGMPDAGDWGGYYIEYQKEGIRNFWIIDKMQRNVPKYLHPFLDKVEEKIALINQ